MDELEGKGLKAPDDIINQKKIITDEVFYPVLDTLKNLLFSVEEKNRLSAANTLTEMMGLRGGGRGVQPPSNNLTQFNLFSPKEAKGFLKAVKELSSKGEIYVNEDIEDAEFEEERYE